MAEIEPRASAICGFTAIPLTPSPMYFGHQTSEIGKTNFGDYTLKTTIFSEAQFKSMTLELA